MPELPEVETTRRGIAPHVLGETVTRVVVREPRLRWPVPRDLGRDLEGQSVRAVARRGKYLLLHAENGCLILHLGMSGSLRLLPLGSPPGAHDHLDLEFSGGLLLRLRDPRRFGAALWTREAPEHHPLLARLGPEPWDPAFDGAYLHRGARGHRRTVKSYIMDGRTVVGVGNIYASEALFAAGIHPARPSERIGLERYGRLVAAIRAVLEEAIRQGGTTLRDFLGAEGEPGYFSQRLAVYERAGRPCPRCAALVRRRLLGQRASYYCPRCQR